MNWCFLGGTSQGIALLNAAIQVLEAPDFVSAPEGLTEDDLGALASCCDSVDVPLVSVDTAFDRLASHPDLRGLVCRYPIIPKSLLSPNRFLNLHNSLLPRWRGVHPLQWALLAGDQETGITYHLCEPEVDSGAICLQKSFSIEPEDDINQLFESVLRLTTETAQSAIENWLKGRGLEQKHKTKMPYARRLDGTTQALTPEIAFETIHRIVKISQPPWPRAYFTDDDGRIEVLAARKKNTDNNQANVIWHEGVALFFEEEDHAARVAALLGR